jgi:uncharacterized protein YbbK (DUF523 family)
VKKSVPKDRTEIRIGISSCLLGKRVRYDAGHKKDSYITDILGAHFWFVPVCPEIEVGMPVPREAVRLEGTADAPRMVGGKTGEDWTDRMNRYSRQRVRKSDLADLSGFIFKSRSPSCGMERVKLYVQPGTVEKKAVGLFARAFMDQFPHLPVEEEGRLTDPALRENFIVRVFAYHRLQQLLKSRFSRGEMVQFHTEHECPAAYPGLSETAPVGRRTSGYYRCRRRLPSRPAPPGRALNFDFPFRAQTRCHLHQGPGLSQPSPSGIEATQSCVTGGSRAG